MKKLLFLFFVLLLAGAGCASSGAPSTSDNTPLPSPVAGDYIYDGVVDAFYCMADTEICEDSSAWFEGGEMTELLIGTEWTSVVAACEDTYCYAIDDDDFEWEVLLLE